MAKISTLLDQIDSGTLVLPEFQRGYVWRRGQICKLMRSAYLGYPLGSLLLWEAEAGAAMTRGDAGEGLRLLLLDGQQRLTTFYGVIRGEPPRFFDQDPEIFRGLQFNVIDEEFQFSSRQRSLELTAWVDVSRLFAQGIGPFLDLLRTKDSSRTLYLDRLNSLLRVLDRDLPEERLTGLGGRLDVVVDVFNQVNSGGTKLSKGDLALAKLCAMAPKTRTMLREFREELVSEGYALSIDLLLRCVTAVATGRANFNTLDGVSAVAFEDAVEATVRYVSCALRSIAENLRLDHDEVLMGRAALPVMCRIIHNSNANDLGNRELYWYMRSALLGRHATSAVTMLGRDLVVCDQGGIDGLIEEMEHEYDGRPIMSSSDFDARAKRTRGYAVMYALSQLHGARDLFTGASLVKVQRSATTAPMHQIFGQSDATSAKPTVQSGRVMANMCFTSSDIGARPVGDPSAVLSAAERKSPGVLASHCIPTDPTMWNAGAYSSFIDARRRLLVGSVADLLDRLKR